MEEIKRKLVKSGVIGRVVADFNPRLGLIIFYGDKGISLGDKVAHTQLQTRPCHFDYYYDASDLELQQIFTNPKSVAFVMTDPDAPGGEYLHWSVVYFISSTEHDPDSRRTELAPYEPPRSGARMLVLTLFMIQEDQPIIAPPKSRESFSTRTFALDNALGSPLGAFFFKIKYENEDEKLKIEGSEPLKRIVASPYWKQEENGSTNDLEKFVE